ncbi:hypothetical protein C0993_003502, partial [Termitomyces sp. T159_Od127]
ETDKGPVLGGLNANASALPASSIGGSNSTPLASSPGGSNSTLPASSGSNSNYLYNLPLASFISSLLALLMT